MTTIERWRLSADRSQIDAQALQSELDHVAETVRDLEITLDLEAFARTPDEGAFRDFAPFAVLSHSHREALEYAAELLLERFGWHIDVAPVDSER